MGSDRNSLYEVSEALRLDFIQEYRGRMERMEINLQEVEDGLQDRADGLNEFRRELHNIKGTAGAFGYPSLSLICHRFEECLLNLPLAQFGLSRVILLYMDRLSEIAETEIEPDEDECRVLLRKLPLGGDLLEAKKTSSHLDLDVEVLLVAGSRTIRHKIRRDLRGFGFHVTTVPDGIVALPLIVRGQPDIVVVSGTVDSIPGFDLIRALVAMEVTSKICVIALTSFDLKHPEVVGLPEGVPVIQLASDLEHQISRALSSTEYRFLKP